MKKEPMTDISLIIEGTYPYVRGGVSSWIHQIVTGLPEFSFTLLFLGSTPSFYAEEKYEVPANVVHIRKCFLMDQDAALHPQPREGKAKQFADVRCLHDRFKENHLGDADAVISQVFDSLLRSAACRRAISFLVARPGHKSRNDIKANAGMLHFWTISGRSGPSMARFSNWRNSPRRFRLRACSTRFPPVTRDFSALCCGIVPASPSCSPSTGFTPRNGG